MESYTGKGRGRVEGMDKATGRAVYAADYYEEICCIWRLSDQRMPMPGFWISIHRRCLRQPGFLQRKTL